ncbi:MAG TPA: NAD(P)H-dependent oxidoreductase subunit E [Solirubrobacterales bacterium]
MSEVRPTDAMTGAERKALIDSMRPEDAADVPELNEVDVPDDLRTEIETAMGKYPQIRSASIPALWAVQRRYGWCTPEGIREAAAVMGVSPAYLESVASFYDLFATEPVGKHRVLVCTNISCWMNGGDQLLDAFRDAAGVEPSGEQHADATSPDGEFEVTGFECLGACDLAPMASIDQVYFGPLDPEDAPRAIAQLRSGEDPLPEKALARRRLAGGSEVPDDPRVTGDA